MYSQVSERSITMAEVTAAVKEGVLFILEYVCLNEYIALLYGGTFFISYKHYLSFRTNDIFLR